MKDTMTPIERQSALKMGKPVDRLPITLFHPAFAAKMAGMTYRESDTTAEKQAKREINMYRQFGVDEVAVMYTALKVRNTLLLKDLNEVDKLDLNLYTFENDKRQQINFQAAELIHAAIGDEVACTYGISAPFTLAGGLISPDKLLRGTRKKPERVHQLLRFTTDFLKQMVDTLAELDYLNYFIYDPVASGSLLSPRQYEAFCLPYTQEIVEHIRQYSDSIALHICGNTSKSLDLIAQTGVDAFSIDQQVDLAFAKETIGGQVTIMGNVDPVEVFMQGNPVTMDAAVRTCFAKAYDSPQGFVIRSGCGVPFDTPAANVEAFMAAARKYGQWPLDPERFSSH